MTNWGKRLARIEAKLDVRQMSDADLVAYLSDALQGLVITPDDVARAEAYPFTEAERAALDAGNATQLSDDALRAYIVRTFKSNRIGGNDETIQTS